jgi:bifunctional non-homologous end joining protein LigD
MASRDRALAIWVKPKLVVEVHYQGIGGKGLLRQPAFKALRLDKGPADVFARTEGESMPSSEATSATTRARKATASGKDKPAAAAKKVRKGQPSDRGAEEVVITHPERVVYADAKRSKQDVADYYRAVAAWMLPEIAGRPLAVMRCPDGAGKACFFQKHVTRGIGRHVHGVKIRGSQGTDRHLCIDDARGLLELVQMNVLEFHPWGARASDVEHADRIVFDLDPHASVKWPRVRRAALDLRKHLESVGLRSYLRTSGGKGLHVVVPLAPAVDWGSAKGFAQAVAEAMAALSPQEFVSVAGEKNRKDRIFIDWLRNGRGATSVASYSLRARPAGGVAMPIAWSDLPRLKSGDAWTLGNALRWIERRRSDPWADIDEIRQSLPDS